jgi:nucleoside 2-deoxyribosyltransferase
MSGIAKLLEAEGYKTFLPQRDGLELTVCADLLAKRGLDKEKAVRALSRAIFALDVYQVIEECSGIVVNLNGRVPDEGAVSEAAIAWAEGKAIVGFKADGRSAFLGQDNPLVAGLFDFKLCDDMTQIVPMFRRAFASHHSQEDRKASRRHQLRHCLTLGERIWNALNSRDKFDQVAVVLSEASAISDR